MHIAFLVNAIESEHPHYTTTLLAQKALARGHEICYLAPGDFVLREDDTLALRATVLPKSGYKKPETLHRDLVGKAAKARTLDVEEIDVLFLRNDPAEDAASRPWATQVGTMFGRLAVERGVLVVNDPEGLALARNKLYLQGFPERVRPATLVSRSLEEVRAFVDAQPKGAIIKPLQGSGGRNVFKVESAANRNLNQIVEAISEEGYLIAQAFVPEARAGDVRMFLMNGEPLELDGEYATMRRVPAEDELRSNMHASGKAAKVRMSETLLGIAATVRPKLVADGMFLVGLDIVGERILEVNVFTPGGLWTLGQMRGVDFAERVIASLESKVAMREAYPRVLPNRVLATL